jgi:hypothetical protein
MTAVELVIASVLLAVVLAGANMMVSASSGLAQSDNHVGIASNRSAHVLRTMTAAVRRASLASVRVLDGTTFSEGLADTGFQFREVTNYVGSAVLSNLVEYRLDKPAGAVEGQLLHVQDGVSSVIANGITAFSVARTGNVFTFDVRTRSGPLDDRGRTAHATVQVVARNP